MGLICDRDNWTTTTPPLSGSPSTDLPEGPIWARKVGAPQFQVFHDLITNTLSTDATAIDLSPCATPTLGTLTTVTAISTFYFHNNLPIFLGAGQRVGGSAVRW